MHVESNGIGDPVVEGTRVTIERFVTSAGLKVKAIQALALLVEKGRLKHRVPQLDTELRLYQWDDEDLVQDCVMAAAIAAHAIGHRSKGIWVPSRLKRPR